MVDLKEKAFEMEDSTSFVEQELEALQSIYINEIEVNRCEEKLTSISIDLYPATADNHDEQYVRMTLKFILGEEYPQVGPEISIRNPRGLSEEKLNSIMQNLSSLAESKTGNSMLFEIIEAAKEHLTNENRPCGECAICLYGFSDDDVFTKTKCYHYFHSHCLARYVKNAASSENSVEANHSDDPSDKKVLCPMCRLPIHFEGSEELYPPPSAKDDEFVIDRDILALQKKMADLYQKQLDKGGIIDIEAEKNKYLLEISNVPTRVNATEKSSPGSTVDDTDSTTEADPSFKTDENACADSQSLLKNKVSGNKDSRTESRNKDKPDNRPRNDRYGYNKHSRNNGNRNNGNSYRGNQRYNRYSKPNTQNYSRKGNHDFATEEIDYMNEQYTDDESSSPQNKHKNAVGDYSENSHDTSPVSESSLGSRSSNLQQKTGRTNFSDSKKYINEKKGNNYRQHSNWDRRYGPNDYEKHGYRGNQRGTKGSPSKNDSPSKNGSQNEVMNDDASVYDSNVHENASESVREWATASAPTERQESDYKNSNKMHGNRHGYTSSQNKRHSYRNGDSDAIYPDDNAQSQEGRKDYFRRGKFGRGFRSNYERQHYRENNYNSQGDRYSQENNHTRNFNQQPRQGDRYSQEKNSYNYEDRRDYNKNRSNDRAVHETSNRKFSSDDKYEYHERENNPQGNISKKSSYRNYKDEQFDDVDSNYIEKGDRYNGRNRNNSHYQNRDQNFKGNRNNRYDSHSSYQNNRNTNRRNTPRKYSDNSDSHYYKGDERTVSESQVSQESVNYVHEKKFSASTEEESVPKSDVSQSFANKIPVQETNVPDTTSDVMPQKIVRPPPGFHNPLKKVVYGLQAANPPPGFPRS